MDVKPTVGRLEADLEQAHRERDECRTQLARKRAEVEELEKQVDDAAHAAIEDKKEIRSWKRKAEDAEAAARREKETMRRAMEDMRRKMSGMEDELRRLQSQGMGPRRSPFPGGKDSPIDISDRDDGPMKMERHRTSVQPAAVLSAATLQQSSASSSTTRTSSQRAKTRSQVPTTPIEISDDEAGVAVKRESRKTESMDTESLFSPMMSPAPSSGRSESISRASRKAGTKRRRPTESESDADNSDAPPVASTSSGRPKRARASVNYRDSVSPAPSENLSAIGRASPVPAFPAKRKKPIPSKPPPKSQRSKPGTSRIPTFPASFLDKYLRSLPEFHISPAPDPTLVGPRASIHPAFGGQYAQLVTEITSVPRMSAGGASTTTTTVFPQHDWNPLLPVAPGAPGLLFASREDVADEGKVYRIFVRVKEETKSVWRYMGEYRLARAGVVPAEVWQGQTDAVKKKWAEHIRDTKKGVYAEMYANVSAAKAQESDEGLALQDIIDALCRGDKDAAIGIIQMRCVRYDHSFAAHLRYAIDHPPPKKNKT
ncbi:hypothetical protein MKEN_00475700 [Mycena kentingensis (nom. inval.)]|nr:hypothetical protein MKEN_00475700 [Mycena kentingensis (nom. inval.)]